MNGTSHANYVDPVQELREMEARVRETLAYVDETMPQLRYCGRALESLETSVQTVLGLARERLPFPRGEITLIAGEPVPTVRACEFSPAFNLYLEALHLHFAVAANNHCARLAGYIKVLRCLDQVRAKKRNLLAAAPANDGATGGEVEHVDGERLAAARAGQVESSGHGGASVVSRSGEQESTERAAIFFTDHVVSPPP